MEYETWNLVDEYKEFVACCCVYPNFDCIDCSNRQPFDNHFFKSPFSRAFSTRWPNRFNSRGVHQASGTRTSEVLGGNVVLAGDGCHAVVPYHSAMQEWVIEEDNGQKSLVSDVKRRRSRGNEVFEVRFGTGVGGEKHSLRTVGTVAGVGAYVHPKEGQPVDVDGFARDFMILRLQDCLGDQLGYFKVPLENLDENEELVNIADIGSRSNDSGVFFQKCKSSGRVLASVYGFLKTNCFSEPGMSGGAVLTAANPDVLYGIIVRGRETSSQVIQSDRFRNSLYGAIGRDPRSKVRTELLQSTQDQGRDASTKSSKRPSGQ